MISASERERRVIHLFKEVGSNVSTWGKDAWDRYISTPWKHGGVYEKAMGIVGAGVSAVTELPDYLLAGAVDKPIAATQFNTGRDIQELLKDVVTLHPLRAITDIMRLTGSLVRDTVVLAGNLRGSRAAAPAKS